MRYSSEVLELVYNRFSCKCSRNFRVVLQEKQEAEKKFNNFIGENLAHSLHELNQKNNFGRYYKR